MKSYSVDLRQKIINVYNNEKISQRQIAKRFCVALSFIVKLLKRYRETGNIAPQPNRCGVKLKLTPDQLVSLSELIADNNDATLKELCQLLKEKTGVTVSRATMGRMTQRLKFTLKKKTLHPTEKETERVQTLRREFWDKIRDVRVEDLIFIDESGVNLAMVRLYARALKGKRAYGTRPQKRGKNVSMVSAITIKEVLTFFNGLGAIDGVSFEAFVVIKLVPKLWHGACVILDNCSVHKGKQVEKAIKEAGGEVIYLPPYSPDFSPIENCWSKLKGILRAFGARTYRALDEAITQAYQQVSEQDLYHWFTHCCYCASSI